MKGDSDDEVLTGRSQLRRAVIAVAAATTVAVASHQTVRVFDADYDVLVTAVAPLVVAAMAMAMAWARVAVRLTAMLVVSLATSAAAVARAGGELPAGLSDALVHGIGDIVAANWPVPVLASGIGALTMIGALAGGLAADLALHRRSAACVVPSVGVLGLVALLSAPAGDPALSVVVAYLVAVVVLLLAVVGGRWTDAARWYTAVVLVVVISVPAGFGAALSSARYDPRDARRQQARVSSSVTPLARLDEWRSITPAVTMFSTSSPGPARWRLVGLTRYDGRTWLPAADYRLSGSQIATPTDGVESTDVDVVIGAIDSVWLPMLDRTTASSVAVRIDGTASALLPERPPVPGDVYSLSVEANQVQVAQLVGARAASADSPFIDGTEPSLPLRELATVITVGALTDLERATRLAEFLATEYVLDPTAPPGHSLAELELFLTRTRRGSDEQFVAAYGVLAASIGLPVRIAVGFFTTTDPGGSGTTALSDRATAWPEVEFDDYGWIAFDPVPTSVNATPPEQGDGAIAPVDDESVPPPTTSPSSPETPAPDDETVADVAPSTSSVSAAVVAPVMALMAVIVGFVLYAGVVLWLKRRKRERRRSEPTSAALAVGAFRSGVDTLVDLGLDAGPSATDHEVVDAAVPVVDHAAELLRPLAVLATAAVFARDEPAYEIAVLSWSKLEQFEQSTTVQVGLFRSLRARLSIRSLRR